MIWRSTPATQKHATNHSQFRKRDPARKRLSRRPIAPAGEPGGRWTSLNCRLSCWSSKDFALILPPEMGMRTLLLAGFLLAGLASQAAARLCGPVAINNTVNGVPVTVSATSYTTVKPVDNDIVVTAQIFADLVDLQKKSRALSASSSRATPVRTKAPSQILSCRSRAARCGRAATSGHVLRGHIDMWSCVAGPRRPRRVTCRRRSPSSSTRRPCRSCRR